MSRSCGSTFSGMLVSSRYKLHAARRRCCQTWMKTLPVGSFTLTFRSLALGVLHRLNGQRVEIVIGIAFLLPAVGIQILPEVALLIEQADADQREVQIAGGFQMIAGEDAQAAGIDGQALGEAVLGGEIGDQLAVGGRGGPCACARRSVAQAER